MSIFRRKKAETESIDGVYLLEQHEKGLLDDTSFLKKFSNAKVFYSTPYGDHKDGTSRLFALPAPNNAGYLPVFTSFARLQEFYENVGRSAYLVMEGTFRSFLEVLRKTNVNAPVKMGALIDPGYYSITVNPDMLNTILRMLRS